MFSFERNHRRTFLRLGYRDRKRPRIGVSFDMNVGDVREVIGNTKGCYICKPEVVDFVKRLSEVLFHRQRTQGREQVQYLAGPSIARKIISVYEHVLRMRGAHSLGRAPANL